MRFICGYDSEEIVEEIRKTEGVIEVNFIGAIKIKDVLNQVALNHSEMMKKDKFVYNVLLAADRFVEDEKDKVSLKGILARIK